MCGLAELMLGMGYAVQGSDAVSNPQTQRLQGMGIQVHIGHSAAHIQGADALIYSTAVPSDNPELQAARAQKLPCLSRPEVVTHFINHNPSIAITGVHGKTTTTAMVASVLWPQQRPNLLMGGVWEHINSTAHLERALKFKPSFLPANTSKAVKPRARQPFFVVEADESDGFIAQAKPSCVVITNIDDEHLDHYGHRDALKAALLKLAQNVSRRSGALGFQTRMKASVKAGGVSRQALEKFLFQESAKPRFSLELLQHACLIVGGDDTKVYNFFMKAHSKGLIARPIFFGFSGRNIWRLIPCKTHGEYQVRRRYDVWGILKPALPGRHNALNALAACVVGHAMGIEPQSILNSLAQFKGIARRMQYKGVIEGLKVYDDYAHHPTEITALLETMKSFFNVPVTVLFQPHKHSRTAGCWRSFKTCFSHCDQVFVTDTYACGEAVVKDRDACHLAQHIQHPKCQYVGSKLEAEQHIKNWLASKPQGILLTLGAGDVYQVGENLCAQDHNAASTHIVNSFKQSTARVSHEL